jgi:glycosyltransferase involved in cell wall biosynthesis
MRVAAIVPTSLLRVGAMVATREYLHHLTVHGHDVEMASPTDAATVARADVVVSHAGDTGTAAALARRWRKPNVRMAHGAIDDPSVLDGAALVVFNSRNLAASIDCPAPWIVCHPPVRAELYRTTPGEHVTLINLSEAKGGELFWRLVRCAPHRSFLGVRGAYGNQYLDTAANATVIATTDNMRDDVYARTRVLLMPSERETWGMTAIEAAASGIPTVAHPTPGLLESLGDAGIYVDRADGQGWLDAIERLHDPTEWAVASARASARSAELDPTDDLELFLRHIEALQGATCVS